MSKIEAAAKRIYEMTEDQPWGAATVEEEERMREVARAVLRVSDSEVEAAANAISKASGMRFDGFWSRVEDLEPEDREYALAEARAALEAARA